METILALFGEPNNMSIEDEWALIARTRDDFVPLNKQTLRKLLASEKPTQDLRWLMLCAAHKPRVRAADLTAISHNVYDMLAASKLPVDPPRVERMRSAIRMDALVATYTALAKHVSTGAVALTKRQLIAYAVILTNDECTLRCGPCVQFPRKGGVVPPTTRPRACALAVAFADGTVWRVATTGEAHKLPLAAPSGTAAIVQMRQSTHDPSWALFVTNNGHCQWRDEKFHLPLTGSNPIKFAAAANTSSDEGDISLIVGGDTSRRGVWTQCFDFRGGCFLKTPTETTKILTETMKRVVVEANDAECPMSFVSLMRRGTTSIITHGPTCLYETSDPIAVAAGAPDNFLMLDQDGYVTHVSGTWSRRMDTVLPQNPVAACVLDEGGT